MFELGCGLRPDLGAPWPELLLQATPARQTCDANRAVVARRQFRKRGLAQDRGTTVAAPR